MPRTKLMHPAALPQLIIITLLLMIACRIIILGDSRQYRRYPLRKVIAFWIGFFIVVAQYLITRIFKGDLNYDSLRRSTSARQYRITSGANGAVPNQRFAALGSGRGLYTIDV